MQNGGKKFFLEKTKYLSSFRYAFALSEERNAGTHKEQENIVSEQEELQPGEQDKKQEVGESGEEEEDAEGGEEVADDDEEEEEEEEEFAWVDDTDLADMRKRYEKARNMANFRTLLMAYLTNVHGPSTPVFKLIRDGIRDIDDIPFEDEKSRRDVFQVRGIEKACERKSFRTTPFFSQFIIDLMEEGEDPGLPSPHDPLPSEFFSETSATAQRLFGPDDILTVKLALLRIFFTEASAGDFVEEGMASPSQLRALFPGEVPNPDTGWTQKNVD